MKKRLISVLISTAMAMTMAASVNVAAEDANATEYQTTYGDKIFDDVTITYGIWDLSTTPGGVTMLDNKWVDYINQEMNKVGITVEIVAIPEDGFDEKCQAMLATGTAPDIIQSWSPGMMEELYNDGGLYSMDEFVRGENQARNLKSYVTEEVLYNDEFTADDGNLYALTGRRAFTQVFNWYIRQDWLDALNMEVPTTVDEFYDMLVAFKENYPDAVPCFPCYYDTTLGQLVYLFSETASDPVRWQANEFAGIYKDDGIVDYFRFMNKLYQEELIDREFFVHNTNIGNEYLYELILTGRVGCFAVNAGLPIDPGYGSLIQTAEANNPEIEYTTFVPPVNEKSGEVHQFVYGAHATCLVMPKTCQNPEAAVTFLDWCGTEDSARTMNWGIEGEHFEMDENNLPVPTENVDDVLWQAGYYNVVTHDTYAPDSDSASAFMSAAYGEYSDLYVQGMKDAAVGATLTWSSYTSPKLVEVSTDIDMVKEQYNVKLITCDPEDFDDLVEEYRQALADLGAEEIYKDNCAYYGISE